ncbi:MAG: nitrate reductase component, cytochrome C-type protein [Symbiobacteriaceae bacterium]|nr:nitrate reductase component, cytochrome C-type protein [Symbiobacteriaceae bacterium]
MKRSGRIVLWVLGALFVLLLAAPVVMAATSTEAKYLCAQCHTMEHQYQTFAASKHAGVISCSDCHVPPGAAGLFTKYTDGARHLFATVGGVKAEDIRISAHGLETALANCINCHADSEHAQQPDSKYCMSCHAEESHGAFDGK